MTRNVDIQDLRKAPTAITAASLLLVLDGARTIDTRSGKLKIALGRLGDLLDGFVARHFNLSSDAGAIADATSDKLGMLAIGISMWRHDIAPRPVLVAMAAKHTVNTAATTYNGLSDPEKRAIRPPRAGKLSMAADTLSLVSFAFADELDSQSGSYKAARALGWTAAEAGIVLGTIAANRYLQGNFDDADA